MSEEPKEAPTTTMIVDEGMIDTIIIALHDSQESCQQRLRWVKVRREKTLTLGEIDTLNEVEALAKTQLQNIPEVLEEIKEVYPELIQEVKEQDDLILPKPKWTT